jgi:hypothetical protein
MSDNRGATIRNSLPVVIIFLLPVLTLAHSGGPPDGRTGAPGEQTCWNFCHNTFPLNSGDGGISITGPEFFEAGQSYTFTVEISDPDQSRWGFEITPLDIGAVIITDLSNTQFSSSGGKLYVKHTSAGTYAGTPNGPVSWSFDWTAPDDPPQTITFYAAGAAANNNGRNSGDYIYTTTFTSNLITTGIIDDPFSGLPSHPGMSNYPNPFNAVTVISYSLPASGHVNLEIFNLRGQLVETLVNDIQSAGEYNITWNANNMPSGLYFYRLSVNDLSVSNKMILLK